ncbi:hypothetical protein B0A75_11430 [Flavobacterium oncorhynchi]|uniref:Uncharacterized protein n=2 Tax=Flavobacterium oncorhynchi TaxID=728056 RepID=A0A226HYW1_9FLAO|nr:hypothetical protein B0A75_11430 [Flavobacterium oncorhynchi]
MNYLKVFYMIQNVNKSNTIGFCFFIFFSLLLWFPAELKAQEQQIARITSDLTFQAENSEFVPLVGGTKVTALSADSAVSTALPIGFTFNTGREDHTTFYASSNGHITFKAGIMAGLSVAPKGNILVLAPLSADLSGVGGTFSYQTSGVAPNRVLTAEWKSWRWAYNSGANVISFQVKMYEGTNTVEYIYDQGISMPSSSAAIGIYFGKEDLYSETAAQLWLTNSGVNPATSEVFVNTITDRPASGQLYRFINKSTIIGYFGQTVINAPGGTNGNDGIRLNISGAGNMQIIRKGTGQIYAFNNNLVLGTTKPFDIPGSTHGLALSIGKDVFVGGSLIPTGITAKKLTLITSTQQSLIESPSGHFENTIKMSAEKNGLTYFLDVKYTYDYPNPYVILDYKVTIPEGNTEKVQLAHAWDTYLSGGDSGPGFVKGTAPNFVMGVFKQASSSYEAFQYKGGVEWSGYFSAAYLSLNSNLNRGTDTFMAFGNLINSVATTDNGIGISMNFGTAPGAFNSENALIFACEAGDVAPKLSTTTAKPCLGTTFNLNSYLISEPPLGVEIVWKNASGVVVADPTNMSTAGTYTVSFYSDLYGCSSPSASLTVSFDATCAVCYKPAVTTGTVLPIKTIISTLDRVDTPRNYADARTGSLILESKEKGLVLTRIASPETAITAPVEGMIVYDTVNKVIKLYNGTSWKAMSQQACPD